MRLTRLPVLAACMLCLTAAPIPAQAADGGVTIDEPTNLALLALGFVGLIVGRRAARRKD